MLNPIIKQKPLADEYKRYARQITIKEINIQGQTKLKKAKILCIGAGGLNSPALLYLAACGIGTLGIIDGDYIETSNLQRQIIYSNHNIKESKAQSAFHTLKSINPYITINSHRKYLKINNIKKILIHYDIIIDGTDNFETRYVISQYCYILHKIHIYGAIEEFTGQISVFNYQNGPHYYSLYSQLSKIQLKNCNNSGIINTLAGCIGTLQATEALKIILGIGSIIQNHLLVFNILQCSSYKIKIQENKLVENITIKSSSKNRNKYISIHTLLKNNKKLYQLIDVRTPLEFQSRYLNQAINIPLNMLKQKRSINHLKQIKATIVIYCNNENRAYIASQILHQYDIYHYILKDGIKTRRKERDSNPR